MSHTNVDARNNTNHTGIVNPKAAVPVLLFPLSFA